MAPPRKKKHAPGEGYEVKLRIPPDVMAIVEEEARASERAFNRTIVNLLASIPHLKGEAKLAASVRQLDVLLPAMAARARKTQATIANAVFLRRTNFRNLYHADGGQAWTGSSFR